MRKADRKGAGGSGPQEEAKNRKSDESSYCKASCMMQQLTNRDLLWRDGSPVGSFFWGAAFRTFDGIEHRCRVLWAKYPDGSIGSIPIRPVPPQIAEVYRNQSWAWDGNESEPTLTPSVHHIGRWHGWIRRGRMESCQ